MIGYIRVRDSWYYTGPLHSDDNAVLNITSRTNTGGCRWEFMIEWHPGLGMRVGVFSDAFLAFSEMPDFFEALSGLRSDVSVGEVIEILDGLGYADFTEETNPAEARV